MMQIKMFTFCLFILIPLQSQALWDCNSIVETWQWIQQRADEGADDDIQGSIDTFRWMVNQCGTSRGLTVDERTEMQFAQVIQRNNMRAYENYNRVLSEGHTGPGEAIRYAELAGQPIEMLRPRIAEQARQNRESCQSRDYRNRLPPSRDQDSIGWCFGFTAADLLSFRTGQNISALDASLAFYDDHPTDFLHRLGRGLIVFQGSLVSPAVERRQRGYNSPALQQGINNGVCLESDLPSEDERFSQLVGDLYDRISRAHEISERGGTTGQSSDGDELSNADRATIRSLAPGLTDEQISELLSNHSENLFTEIRSRACPNRLPVEGTVVTHTTDLKPNISEQLNSGNIVAISYDSGVLYSDTQETEDVNHASSIVGQRWNEETDQCEFLLRNTWGTDCSYADNDYECEPDGHIWIPSRVLTRSIGDISYIQ